MSSTSSPGRRALLAAAAATAVTAVTGSSARAQSPAAVPPPAGHPRPLAARPLYLGTYTSQPGGGTGIGLASYDTGSGRITATGTVPGVADPSFLALAPSGRALYAVGEGQPGSVTAIAVTEDGRHEVLNSRPTGGDSPCHLSVHPSGRFLLSANYGSGSVAVHPIAADGSLGERTDLVTHTDPPPGPGQTGPHAHQILTTPDGGHVLAVDLGSDSVHSYRLDVSAGTLIRVSVATLPPGAGPRALAFHPSGRHAYLANELNDTIAVCGYDPDTGRLTPGTPQPTGTGDTTSYPAQPVVSGDGAYAYLTNRGHNSISHFAVERDGAELRLLGTVAVGGDWPRHLALSPDGAWMFASNQRSGTVTVFAVDPATGTPAPAGAFTAPVPVFALPL
ncbi:lactonase family protein [Streptomyces zingiberis]|uniref:Lactonase family protein n=1 Tax=Streptomyces zingiberis TaxID=2053010 RepID=A0ABX1BWQ3_9ACTN|nr:lactonase family protein [Streptomyces zingiberis]NJQ00172.1 lactonase family protein [Streptomyces zingiberis]